MIEQGPQSELTSDQEKRVFEFTRNLINNNLRKEEQNKALLLLECKKHLTLAISVGKDYLSVGSKHYLEEIAWILLTVIQAEIMKENRQTRRKTVVPTEKPWMKYNRYS